MGEIVFLNEVELLKIPWVHGLYHHPVVLSEQEQCASIAPVSLIHILDGGPIGVEIQRFQDIHKLTVLFLDIDELFRSHYGNQRLWKRYLFHFQLSWQIR